jgi:hypothetical protein
MSEFTERRRLTRTGHEVEHGSNLDMLLRAFIRAVNSVGGGLQAIALALSTPQDNSAQVRAMIDKLNTAGDKLQDAINKNQPN